MQFKNCSFPRKCILPRRWAGEYTSLQMPDVAAVPGMEHAPPRPLGEGEKAVYFRCQMSRLYCSMVRSLEKKPHRAVFTSIFRAQKGLSP